MPTKEWIERELDQFGWAKVLVTIQHPVKATSVAAKTDVGASVLDHFLERIPEEAGGAAAAFAKGRSKRSTPGARQFPRLGVAFGYVDCERASRLDNHTAVRGLYPIEQLSLVQPTGMRAAQARSEMTWGLLQLKIKKLWEQGLTGKGVKVGHLDTGIDTKHPAFRGRHVEYLETDLDGNRVPGATPRESDLQRGHGTHTAGTLCGGKIGTQCIGVAPGVDLFSGMVIEGGEVLLRVLEGMEWALEQEVSVLSMSLGFPGYRPFLEDVTRQLRAQGVVPVFAIGNERAGSSRSPGNYPEAISVGASDRAKKVTEISSSITFQRSIEPNQPNVVAPGEGVISAKAGGGVRSLDGTSVATPHVAGIAALLRGAVPSASVDQIERAIQSTCTPLPKSNPLRYGHGLVNPPAALDALLAGGSSP